MKLFWHEELNYVIIIPLQLLFSCVFFYSCRLITAVIMWLELINIIILAVVFVVAIMKIIC